MEMLLLGGYLLPGKGEVKKDWGVAVKDGIIRAVGDNHRLKADFPAYRIMDCSDKIISPGFINSHMHSYGILSHGITPPVEIDSFETFLNSFWWPLVENQIDHEMIRISGKATALELLNSGVTCLCDVLEAPNALPCGLEVHARVIEEIGMRAVLSFEACERVNPQNAEAGLKENLDFFKKYREHPLISGMMCIHTTFTCSREYIQRAARMAREAGSGIQMHLSESKYEPDWCLKKYGKLPVEVYEELGYWGSDVLASQGVKLTMAEMDILQRRGVNLVHVPLSNCEVGGGFSPVPDLLSRGINVGLGTDGYINNFFEVMRGAFLIHKANMENPEAMPGDVVFRMATENGGRALGISGLGELKEGAPADIITIRADFPTPLNAANLFSQMILYRNPEDVREVMVNGRFLKENGRLLGHDLDAVHRDVCLEAERLWKMGR
ncbi:MAG: amidohydrolase family protein [Spirochaetales bacterium]|nr:amidohydrolase family protein [Spirochaetales bacterium]